jgi:apolipoprotein N-acyltransferase
MWLRTFAIGVLILALEFVHGAARTLWLSPLVGDLPARQIGVAVGSVIILVVAWLAIRWIDARSPRQLLAVGLAWTALMVSAELVLGRALFGYPWSRIADDFDPSRGGLLAFGMLVLLMSPTLAHRWRPPSNRVDSGE